MKRIIKVFLFVVVLANVLFVSACSGASYTKVNWVYDDVVAIKTNLKADQSIIDEYLVDYGVATVEELEAAVLAEYKNDEQLKNFYINFKGNKAYVYDYIMNRDATYFHREINGEVVLALTELQYDDPNPEVGLDPEICPRFIVSADGTSAQYTFKCGLFYITVSCVAE